jgi:hypothetical protein
VGEGWLTLCSLGKITMHSITLGEIVGSWNQLPPQRRSFEQMVQFKLPGLHCRWEELASAHMNSSVEPLWRTHLLKQANPDCLLSPRTSLGLNILSKTLSKPVW